MENDLCFPLLIFIDFSMENANSHLLIFNEHLNTFLFHLPAFTKDN